MNPNQQFRHEARGNILVAVVALTGEPGLTPDEQLERLAVAATALAKAKIAVAGAMNLVATRKAEAEAAVVKAAEAITAEAV